VDVVRKSQVWSLGFLSKEQKRLSYESTNN